jgi:hypothetical protein
MAILRWLTALPGRAQHAFMMMSDTVGSASMPFWRGSGGKGGVQRPLIVAAVVICVAWTVAAALIHARVFWLFAVLQVGPALAFLAALVASVLPGSTKPAGFEVREGVGFVVPASREFGFLVVGEVAMMAFLSGQLIHIWTWGGADETIFRFWAGAVLSVALLVACGLVALLVVTALRGRPQILLTPSAVVQEDWWANRTIPWEALRPGRPLGQVRGRTLTLIVDRPDLVVRRGLFRRSTRRPWLVTGHLRVHPWFLADAIGFYVGHPERRDAISSWAEYERLLPELGVPAV